MQLNISGHHVDVTDALRSHIEKKLLKIKNHFSDVINIKMILDIEKNIQKAEAEIHSRGANFFAKAQSNDMYLSINQLVSKLESQIIKHKEKLHNHRD